jgi:hypothetical protein
MLVALRFDLRMHRELPSFISTRDGVSLCPGDGVILSCLSRLLLPDTVGDSPTRFPICISFLVGSVLVRFKGKMQEDITMRSDSDAMSASTSLLRRGGAGRGEGRGAPTERDERSGVGTRIGRDHPERGRRRAEESAHRWAAGYLWALLARIYEVRPEARWRDAVHRLRQRRFGAQRDSLPPGRTGPGAASAGGRCGR